MIPRALESELLRQLQEFPVVTVLGPRQSGKTTLVRNALPEYDYVTLEDPDTRAIAVEDPRALLKRHRRRVIFDEIQRTPHLLSYLQGIVDSTDETGQFVLTGSHQLELRAAIVQSLAGRTGMLFLLPLSIAELSAARIAFDTFENYIFHGFLPRLHHKNQRPHTTYSAYYQTYVERDVRQLIRLTDATLFEKFIKLLAGRTGQVINYQSLAGDVGVDAKTVKHWLSILEASFLVFKLPPYFENFGKRVIKSPKYYFMDTGLLAYILGIENAAQVVRDPLVGNLFENLVVLEAIKARANKALPPNLFFFRNHHGLEIDLMYRSAEGLVGIEVKSASTYNAAFKKRLQSFTTNVSPLARSYVVYSGETMEFSDRITALNYTRTADIFVKEAPARGKSDETVKR